MISVVLQIFWNLRRLSRNCFASVLSESFAPLPHNGQVPTFASLRRNTLARLQPLANMSIPARSAAVSAIVVLIAFACAGAVLVAVLYRSLLMGIDDATAARVHNIANALQSNPPGELSPALLVTNHRIVAVQIIAPDGTFLHRSGSAPATPLVLTSNFDYDTRRGMPDDAVADDDMRVSGQRVATRFGTYTVIVGGASEAAEATARVGALLLTGSAPFIVAVAAAVTHRLVRRSLQSVDAIRSRVAEISVSDLAERVPVPAGRDHISALAVTMNEMLSRLEAGHLAQQRFVGNASHELRSPLATIISGLEVVEAHPELLDTDLAVKTLLPEAHRMQALIDDLLVLARADENSLMLRREAVALDDIAAVEADRARGTTQCVISTNVGPAHTIGDPAALSLVIRNLVSNALQHAHSRVDVATTSRSGIAAVSVCDDGPGIAPSERSRVFERFVRLDEDRDRRSGGAGLGLAIVAELVAAHGGTVTIDDSPWGGTTILVELPQHDSR